MAELFGFILGLLLVCCVWFALLSFNTFFTLMLWNGVAVSVLHAPVIDFWQAMQICLLGAFITGFGSVSYGNAK